MMGIKTVELKLAEIKKKAELASDDPHVAFTHEVTLWYEVLNAISEGIENPQELAKECLKSLDIEFKRW